MAKRNLVMKNEDRLSIDEAKELLVCLRLQGIGSPHGQTAKAKLIRCLKRAEEKSEKAYLIRNTETRRPQLRLVKP